MLTFPSVVQKQIDRILKPGENVKRAYYSSCSKVGGPGESWLVATADRIIIGSQSLTADMKFVSYPLSKITGIERDNHGLGRGTLCFVSNGEKVDELTYSALESDTFAEADRDILALMKHAGIRVPPPATPSTLIATPPPPPKEKVRPATPTAKPVSTTAAKTPTKIAKTSPAKKVLKGRPVTTPTPKPVLPPRPRTPVAAPRAARKTPRPSVQLQRVSGKGSGKMQVFLPGAPYHPGETIPGKVALKLGKGESISTRGIRFHLMGSEKASVTRGSGKSSTTYTEKHTIIEEETVLFGAGSTSFSDTISDAFEYLTGSKKAPKFPSGDHEWNVQILIPFGAPPSFKGKYGKVTYTAKAYVDVPLGFDIVKHVELPVSGPGNRRGFRFVPMNEKTGGVLSLFTNQSDVLLRAAVQDFVWGEDTHVHGTMSFENPTKRKIRGVRVRAYYLEEAWPKGVRAHAEWKSKQNYARLGFTGKSFPEKPFKIPVPSGPIPFSGKSMKLDLIVEVALDLPICPDFRIMFVAVPKG